MTSNVCIGQPRRATDPYSSKHSIMIDGIVVVECDALSPVARARGGRSVQTMRQRIERMTQYASRTCSGGGATSDDNSDVVFVRCVTLDRFAG